MFSLFQLFSVLFVLFIAACIYIGRKVFLATGKLPFGLTGPNDTKDTLSFVTRYLCYALMGFTKIFEAFGILSNKEPKQEKKE